MSNKKIEIPEKYQNSNLPNPPEHDYDALRIGLESPEEITEQPKEVPQITSLRKVITYQNQHTDEKVKTHATNRNRTIWEDPTPTVVPGLAPDLKAIMAQQKMGIPVNIATRTIETYFKNQDLTDIAEMSNAYAQLATQIQEKQQAYKEMQKNTRQKQQQDANRIIQYLDQQNKQQQLQNLQQQIADNNKQMKQI